MVDDYCFLQYLSFRVVLARRPTRNAVVCIIYTKCAYLYRVSVVHALVVGGGFDAKVTV